MGITKVSVLEHIHKILACNHLTRNSV